MFSLFAENAYFCSMFCHYSEDIEDLLLPELKECCIHMLCLTGEGSLVYDDRCFHFVKGDLLVLPQPQYISNLAVVPGTTAEMFSASYRFLQSLLPANNYSIGGGISLYGNPVIPLKEKQAQRFLDDIRRIRERMSEEEKENRFYREQIGSLCLTMMYDIFESHAERDGGDSASDRAGFIVKELLRLLGEGTCRTERSVEWYASQLHVTPKYLSDTVKRLTGRSVMHYIDQHTRPILKEMLDNPRISLTQIADRMNFSSLSYFSRYCTKHLGQSPSAYRASLQPGK